MTGLCSTSIQSTFYPVSPAQAKGHCESLRCEIRSRDPPLIAIAALWSQLPAIAALKLTKNALLPRPPPPPLSCVVQSDRQMCEHAARHSARLGAT